MSQIINLQLSRNQLASLRPLLEQLSNTEQDDNHDQDPDLEQQIVLPVYRTPVRGADYRRGQSISPAGSTTMDSNTSYSAVSSPESDGLYLSDCSKTKNSTSSSAHSFVHVSLIIICL